jgi:hypothetical protein
MLGQQFMLGQLPKMAEFFIANLAYVEFLTSTFMDDQIFYEPEFLGANFAFGRLLTNIYTFMDDQIAWFPECFLANFALGQLLTSMNSCMLLQLFP